MTASELVTAIGGGGIGLILVLMTIIQISPIKVDPWTKMFRGLGKMINADLIEKNADLIKKVDKLDKDLADLRAVCDIREANGCRTRILHFNDEMIHGSKHTKEHFDQILIDISSYENYCDTHSNYKNNIADLAIHHIKSAYQKCQNENTFL